MHHSWPCILHMYVTSTPLCTILHVAFTSALLRLKVAGYDKTLSTMAALKKNDKFQSYLKKKRKDSATGGLDIMSFLIMPVQRMYDSPFFCACSSRILFDPVVCCSPRYELLLRE